MGSRHSHTRLADLLRIQKRADSLELSKGARQRLQWFIYSAMHDGNVSLTCRYFGISRSTFLRWIERFDPLQPETLEEHSRRPHHVRESETSDDVVALIKKYRTENVLISKEQIEEELRTKHNIALSALTIGRVIAREGFFFADTPAHRRKRNQKLNLDVGFLPKKKHQKDHLHTAGEWAGPLSLPSPDIAS
jgi:transposase